ncbi:MAG: DNA mismatch repair protein MutS [Halobacteriovoraceae bacterium]|nr:DNA mismatch repair protein MutS [Halobacteriovoraceae bacterium]
MLKDQKDLGIEDIVALGVKLTPMMEQYYQIKKNYSDTLVLFRMGDFYEVFFNDAKETARRLNITLTHRGKLGEYPIPMAGIPHHAASTYIDRLTGQGLKVAICEQVEDPKETKGIVKRAVTQIVSPGLPYDLEKTSANENSYMLCAYQIQNAFYLIAMDYTTGAFYGHILHSESKLIEKIQYYSPKEFITYLGQWDNLELVNNFLSFEKTLHTNLSEEYFDPNFTSIFIEKFIPSYKRDQIIKMNRPLLNVIGALAYYVCSTQDSEMIYHIRPFKLINDEGLLKVSIPTLKGLEILPRDKDRYRDSLLGLLDKTKTALGARYLRTFILTPSLDINEIIQRQEIIKFFIDNHEILQNVREDLFHIRDIERILAKVSNGKATSDDLHNISKTIMAYQTIVQTLGKSRPNNLGTLSDVLNESLTFISKSVISILNDELGASLEKGNLIKDGHSKKRDKLAKLALNATDEILQLEELYREKTGIPKLKIKHNNVAGYFVEVSKSSSEKLPKSFERRQTLVNTERFSTKELIDFEKEVVNAKDKLEKLEREIFKGLINIVKDHSKQLQELASEISNVDVYQSLAWVAHQEDFVCPQIDSKKKIFKCSGAWHPLIKANIKDQFVSHDIILDDINYFGLITGPNMAGKTTVMREVAIIQLLAQIGSFVPAESAVLSPADYIFSRLGASDDILRGQSTFMVEMSETAEIIRHATEKSLVILDEVGRGTSTYDGLSIAWSLVEYFVKNIKSRTLFATHYHELIELAEELNGAKNLTVEIVNNNGRVEFLYRLIEKAAEQSYGIYVAELAGLPREIINRSQSLLKDLETQHHHDQNKESKSLPDYQTGTQLCFFQEPVEVQIPKHLEVLESELEKIDVLRITPIDALIKLQKLKEKVNHLI